MKMWLSEGHVHQILLINNLITPRFYKHVIC